MFEALLEPLGREALGRVTLLLNHVLSAEPEATRRLTTQVGRTVGVQWRQWPAMLPPPPRAVWSISPAGLLDLDEDLLLVPVGVGEVRLRGVPFFRLTAFAQPGGAIR